MKRRTDYKMKKVAEVTGDFGFFHGEKCWRVASRRMRTSTWRKMNFLDFGLNCVRKFSINHSGVNCKSLEKCGGDHSFMFAQHKETFFSLFLIVGRFNFNFLCILYFKAEKSLRKGVQCIEV